MTISIPKVHPTISVFLIRLILDTQSENNRIRWEDFDRMSSSEDGSQDEGSRLLQEVKSDQAVQKPISDVHMQPEIEFLPSVLNSEDKRICMFPVTATFNSTTRSSKSDISKKVIRRVLK